jgi:pyridoxamine 5'-phosphate oxidase
VTEGGLDERTVDRDPITQFRSWLAAARDSGIPNVEAMVVASATPEAVPSARVVLLRGLDERGFVFFTNYESRKGRELETNAHAALVFYWDLLGRQVRVTGRVSRVSPAESSAYFTSRPLGSRLGAWASPQSDPIASRAELEQRLAEIEKRFPDGNPPVPPSWGGFRVTPDTIEFWEHRESRLHDRVRYTRLEHGWQIERLAP